MTEENSENIKEVVDATPWMVLLTIFLLVGKVAGWWANMSWMWVFAPIWLPFAFVIGLIGVIVVVGIIVFLVALIATALDR